MKPMRRLKQALKDITTPRSEMEARKEWNKFVKINNPK